MKKLAPILLSACLMTALPGIPCAAPDVSTLPPPLSIKSVEADPVYDPVFVPQKRGFLGADGAASVALGNGRVLWVFGDTVLGKIRDGKREGPMVRNSIAILDQSAGAPGKVAYHWDFADRIPGDFFRPPSEESREWYWPGCGVMVDGTAYLFLTRLTNTDGSMGMGFETVDCTLFRIANPADPPERWQMTKADLGYGNQHFNINAAAYVESGFVYLLGYSDGPMNLPLQRAAILCRLPVAALKADKPGEAIEFWSEGGKWLPKPDNATTLFRPGTTETSLHYDPVRKRYIAFSIVPFKPDMLMFSAEKLTGPWSAPQKIYDIPGIEKQEVRHAYAARAHPMLGAGPDELLITYVVNTTDFWAMFKETDIYYPRFIRVKFGAPAEPGGAK